jgi:hypothetical protein
MQPLPHTGQLPIPQAAPAGHPAATAQLLGQHLPGDARHEHEEDTGEGGAIRNAGTSAPGFGPLDLQERGNQCP